MRNFHELVIEFVLLDFETTWVGAGQRDSRLKVGALVDIFHHVFGFHEKVHPVQF